MVSNVFSNEEFGQIRTVTIDDKPWFIGRDIAAVLGYGDGNSKSKALSNAVNDHVDEEDKKLMPYEFFKGCQIGDLKNISHYGVTIINESGLYALIFGSKLESAKRFKHWVTSEVLPTIRKTGGYLSESVDAKLQAFMERQEEFNQMMMSKLENLTCNQIQQTVNHDEGCFSAFIKEKDDIQGRKETLNQLVEEMAETCNWDKNFALHRLYKTLEEVLSVSLDEYMKIYQVETGNICASSWKVVLDSDRLYKTAVKLCTNTIRGMKCQ